jgi:hypothetical protein
MARWKLTAKHYIYAEQYGQPTEWERQETNVQTGRMFRRTYRVPLYIDPEDSAMWNKTEGCCVVAIKGSERAGDIVFFGDPTADMEPLDDEAREISDQHRHKWINPIESLAPSADMEFGKQILQFLESQLDKSRPIGSPVSLANAPNADVDALKAIVAKQQAMIEQLLGQAKPADATAAEAEALPKPGPDDKPFEFEGKLPPDGVVESARAPIAGPARRAR